MKIIDSSVSILEQKAGIDGMKKHIEKCARICYKSEDKVTKDSYVKFLDMLYQRGHWNALSMGTVYLTIPKKETEIIEKLKATHPFTRWFDTGKVSKITTNYRVICQLNLQAEMETYWTEPDRDFYHRITADFVCSRSTSHQIVRHRAFCMLQESQRYCNYSKDKFEDGVLFIIPQVVYKLRDNMASTISPSTGGSRAYLNSLEGQELWDALLAEQHPFILARDNFWKACEDEYLYETTTEFRDIKVKPEDARGVLCNDVKTELVFCGFVEDWIYEPKEDSKEKAGFFYLRTASDAQPDVRVLAQALKEQFEFRKYYKLK